MMTSQAAAVNAARPKSPAPPAALSDRTAPPPAALDAPAPALTGGATVTHILTRQNAEAVGRPRPLGASMTRRKREHDFGVFKQTALRFFESPPFDQKHYRMKGRNGFFVSARSVAEAEAGAGPERAPQTTEPETLTVDARSVEVFYGTRPVKNFHHLNQERLQLEWRSVRETGAALLYSQGDDGVVSAFLYPAMTDNLRPEEDAIMLGRYADLEVLTGRRVIEGHWRALRAYAEVTSIDGEPSLSDQLRVRMMRFTKTLVRSGRMMRAEIEKAVGGVVRFAAAVALSALLVTSLL